MQISSINDRTYDTHYISFHSSEILYIVFSDLFPRDNGSRTHRNKSFKFLFDCTWYKTEPCIFVWAYQKWMRLPPLRNPKVNVFSIVIGILANKICCRRLVLRYHPHFAPSENVRGKNVICMNYWLRLLNTRKLQRISIYIENA